MFEYNDGLQNAGRTPRLFLAMGGKAVKFEGRNIPGYCAVAKSHYTKNGKWSCTDYSLDLAVGVRALSSSKAVKACVKAKKSFWEKYVKGKK